MGKGRQQTPADQTVVQSNLPKYVRPYFERLLDRTEAESLRDYEPFEGQRLAGEAQDTLESRRRARDIAGTPIAPPHRRQQLLALLVPCRAWIFRLDNSIPLQPISTCLLSCSRW